MVIVRTCHARMRWAMAATTSVLRRVETLTWMVIRMNLLSWVSPA